MPPNRENLLIKLNQIRFKYANQSVLDIPSWHVAGGQNVLLIGSSGSGKSTLLNLLSGILVPDSGDIVVVGHTLQTMKSRQRDRFRAANIGYVAQRFNLIPYLSAIDNIKLANHFAQHSVRTPHELGIEALLLELNLDGSLWHRPINQLSIGQQQRVAIARAIINKPALLIADEPTSSLDPANRDAFMSLLMETAKVHQMTLIFVSHDLALCDYFDSVDSMTEINTLNSDAVDTRISADKIHPERPNPKC